MTSDLEPFSTFLPLNTVYVVNQVVRQAIDASVLHNGGYWGST